MNRVTTNHARAAYAILVQVWPDGPPAMENMDSAARSSRTAVMEVITWLHEEMRKMDTIDEPKALHSYAQHIIENSSFPPAAELDALPAHRPSQNPPPLL